MHVWVKVFSEGCRILVWAAGATYYACSNQQRFKPSKTYGRALQLAGEPPWLIACEAHLGLARIFYQRNELPAAHQQGEKCLHLTRQIEAVDTYISYGVFLARLRLAQGDVPGATAALEESEAFSREHDFMFRMPDVATVQVLASLRRGNLAAAMPLAQAYELPLSRARVHLAQGDASAALARFAPWRQQVETKDWAYELLEVNGVTSSCSSGKRR